MGGRKCCLPPLLWPPPLQSEFTERQTPPPLAADLYFSSRLLLYTFIKSTFRDGNSVGALHKCLSQRQRWCSTCLHLFPFLLVSPFFSSFSSPPPFFFFFFDYVAYIVPIPRILKETWCERLLFNLYEVPLSWKGKYTHCTVRVKKKLNGVREVDEKSLIDEGRKSIMRGKASHLGKVHWCLGEEATKSSRGARGCVCR